MTGSVRKFVGSILGRLWTRQLKDQDTVSGLLDIYGGIRKRTKFRSEQVWNPWISCKGSKLYHWSPCVVPAAAVYGPCSVLGMGCPAVGSGVVGSPAGPAYVAIPYPGPAPEALRIAPKSPPMLNNIGYSWYNGYLIVDSTLWNDVPVFLEGTSAMVSLEVLTNLADKTLQDHYGILLGIDLEGLSTEAVQKVWSAYVKGLTMSSVKDLVETAAGTVYAKEDSTVLSVFQEYDCNCIQTGKRLYLSKRAPKVTAGSAITAGQQLFEGPVVASGVPVSNTLLPYLTVNTAVGPVSFRNRYCDYIRTTDGYILPAENSTYNKAVIARGGSVVQESGGNPVESLLTRVIGRALTLVIIRSGDIVSNKAAAAVSRVLTATTPAGSLTKPVYAITGASIQVGATPGEVSCAVAPDMENIPVAVTVNEAAVTAIG